MVESAAPAGTCADGKTHRQVNEYTYTHAHTDSTQRQLLGKAQPSAVVLLGPKYFSLLIYELRRVRIPIGTAQAQGLGCLCALGNYIENKNNANSGSCQSCLLKSKTYMCQALC